MLADAKPNKADYKAILEELRKIDSCVVLFTPASFR